MSLVSDIKLIRTDTTLDLSQKAEKGMLLLPSASTYILVLAALHHSNLKGQQFGCSSSLPLPKERKTDKSRYTPAL